MTDLYTRAVAAVLDIEASEVTKQQRAEAKQICFSVVYGGGPERLQKEYDASQLLKLEVEQKQNEEKIFEEVCKMLRFAWGLQA